MSLCWTNSILMTQLHRDLCSVSDWLLIDFEFLHAISDLSLAGYVRLSFIPSVNAVIFRLCGYDGKLSTRIQSLVVQLKILIFLSFFQLREAVLEEAIV